MCDDWVVDGSPIKNDGAQLKSLNHHHGEKSPWKWRGGIGWSADNASEGMPAHTQSVETADDLALGASERLKPFL